MTNFERFKDEIKRIIDSGNSVAVSNGKPVECTVKNCEKYCDFNEIDNACSCLFTKWLYEDSEEPRSEENEESRIKLPQDIKVDAPILVSHDGLKWARRYFARVENDKVYAWVNGGTSWSSKYMTTTWEYARLSEEGKELLAND